MNNEDILARIKISILERLKPLMLCDRNEPWADGDWRETSSLGNKERLRLSLSNLVLSIPKSWIWGWVDWQSSLTRHMWSNIPLRWPEVGISTAFTEAGMSDFGFGNSAVYCGGMGRRIWGMRLRTEWLKSKLIPTVGYISEWGKQCFLLYATKPVQVF